MLWVKALHVVAMVAWFAGIFYLPRLFVYHAMTPDQLGHSRFVVMERKLYWAIMTPAAALTCGMGGWLLWGYAWAAWGHQAWLHLKIALVGLLLAYHLACGLLMRRFARGSNRYTHQFYRVFNEVPVLLLVAIVCLVVVKPWAQ